MLEIRLKRVESKEYDHGGYGAGSGTIIREEYECPCGIGRVIYEKDDIPGFREKHIYCDCEDCDKQYEFYRGIAIEK